MAGNVIVVGAGIWGCTVARVMAERGNNVTVLEKRRAIGGNAACETDPETGIEIHSYGSHIFHTHNPEVWSFIRRFTEFNGYQHKVLANYRGKTYFLPLGLNLVNKFFNVELKPSELSSFLSSPTSTSTSTSSSHSSLLFDAFIRGYTSKQWGRQPEEIDPSIIKRLPIRDNYDTNYFNDYWQGIPADGYNELFKRMLDHPNITVKTSTPFSLSSLPSSGSHTAIFLSCPLDELFDYRFGALPWRSLRFDRETLEVKDFQGTAVVNYTEAEVPFTRIHEFKHYHPENREVMECGKTVICREYPEAWERGKEQYYPVESEESRALAAKYRGALEELNGELAGKGIRLVAGGRLGAYRYFNMDEAVADAFIHCR